jgi:hypothetical protein
MSEDTWRQLARPFPPEKVKQKRGQGGRTMDFISHGLVTERLNDADPSWASRVLAEHTYTDPQTGRLHCEGVTIELTVLGVSRVEAGGPQRQDGFANEIKNAYSDALKRAAMRFGVALGMWESLIDAEYDEDAHPDTSTPRAGTTPGREPAPRSSPQRPTPSDRPAAVPSAAGPPSPEILIVTDAMQDFRRYAIEHGVDGGPAFKAKVGKPLTDFPTWEERLAALRAAVEPLVTTT